MCYSSIYKAGALTEGQTPTTAFPTDGGDPELPP